jgi:hypothetical protein
VQINVLKVFCVSQNDFSLLINKVARYKKKNSIIA